MKVYGWEEGTAARGELVAANAEAWMVREQPAALQAELGWEFLSPSFSSARDALGKAMQSEGADPELIAALRSTKRDHVPVG